MKVCKSVVLITLIISFLHGCGSNHIRSGIPPSFIDGLAAIDRKDFAEASYHFAELAKEGDPGSMNNLGVSLLMVDRKDEAIYWFKKASRYGDSNAKLTLEAMGEAIPPSDLIGQHPTQLQQEAANKFIVATLLGVAAGVTTYYAGQGALNRYSYPMNNGFRSQINSSGITPDGSYVGGRPQMAPDGYQHGWKVYEKPQPGYTYGSVETNPYGPGGSQSYGPGGGKSYGEGGGQSYGQGGGKSYGEGGGESYGQGGGKNPSNPWRVRD